MLIYVVMVPAVFLTADKTEWVVLLCITVFALVFITQLYKATPAFINKSFFGTTFFFAIMLVTIFGIVSFTWKKESATAEAKPYVKAEPGLASDKYCIHNSAGNTSGGVTIVNMDCFPDDRHLVFSKSFEAGPNTVNPNLNHDKVTIEVNNTNKNDLVIKSAQLSEDELWKVSAVNNKPVTKADFPLTIAPAGKAYITVAFTGKRINERASNIASKALMYTQFQLIRFNKTLKGWLPFGATNFRVNGTLKLLTNDKVSPEKTVFLNGLWQYRLTGDWEPNLQTELNTMGFGTRVGFGTVDNGNKGESVIAGTDEIGIEYFMPADVRQPVRLKKIASYHGCCTVADADTLLYFNINDKAAKPICYYNGQSGQTLLPVESKSNENYLSFKTSLPFGFMIGNSNTDRNKNYKKKIGIRVWKAVDQQGHIIKNTYIMGSDYLGTKGTNYDYQDEVYYIDNVLPYHIMSEPTT